MGRYSMIRSRRVIATHASCFGLVNRQLERHRCSGQVFLRPVTQLTGHMPDELLRMLTCVLSCVNVNVCPARLPEYSPGLVRLVRSAMRNHQHSPIRDALFVMSDVLVMNSQSFEAAEAGAECRSCKEASN